jgi:predicted RNA-binding Zn-ribbon protein involved in translation (DUF1610 family)
MGKAARAKRDLREAGPLPARFAFGPEFLARSTVQAPDLLGVHDFDETGERPCPRCGGDVVYRYGNWLCISYVDPASGDFTLCNWSSAREVPQGKATLEKCPDCGGTIVYNGNYFCEHFGSDCPWALPHPTRKRADRELALRLTGKAS